MVDVEAGASVVDSGGCIVVEAVEAAGINWCVGD